MVAFPKPVKKVKKKKRKKKNPYTMKKADILFSQIIRVKGRCEAKGLDSIRCNGNLQCAHIIGRGNRTLRFDEMNALCLCASHHFWYTNHYDEWILYFIPQYFPKNSEYVLENRRRITKPNYKEIIPMLQERLDMLVE